MNIIHRHLCPICSKVLDHDHNDDATCPDRCYQLNDYGSIQDVTINLLGIKITFSIYHDTNEEETFVFNKAGKKIFKLDYLIPIDFNNISKFEDRIKALVIFS